MTTYATTGNGVGRSPSTRRRLVGGALRRYRQQVGYALADAARLLDCHTSKISRIETGQRGIRRKELCELLAGYGVGEAEQAALVALARPAAADFWWQEYTDVLAPAFTEVLALEAAASEILIWAPYQVPGLLQTAGYAAGAGDTLAAVMLARQQAVLSQRQTELTVVIGEAALKQMLCGPESRREQLAALAKAAENSPSVTVQVLSAGSKACAVGSGPVTMFGFGGARGPVAVWLEGPGQSGTFVVDQVGAACYALAFAHLARHALSSAESAWLLRDLARD